jgi:hypothetical protein
MYPTITFDERPCQLIDDVIQPIPMKAGQPTKQDYHYKRNGVCNVLIAFEPHTGQRIVEVTKQRTKRDYAIFFEKVATHYPSALAIRVVQDNLNTHNPSSFYETFEAENAFELSQLFEMHYTPVHASWLNMAEIELSAMSKQCLDRRIGDIAILEREVTAWTVSRNKKRVSVDWQFSIDKARDKFKRFYPNDLS